MKRIIICLFTLCVSALYSQTTNTSRWRKTEKDSMANAFLLYEEKNYKMALPYFDNIHHGHPKEEFVKYVYGKTCLYRSDKYGDALQMLQEVYDKNPKVDMIEFDLARAMHYNYKFDEALVMVAKYLENKRTRPEDKVAAELLKKYIQNAKYYASNTTQAKITNIGGPINTRDEEYVPTISADESMMVFTYTGVKSKGGKINEVLMIPDSVHGIYLEDVYMSIKANDIWQAPVSLENINSKTNDAAISLSQDGQVLFIYKDDAEGHGDIYQSNLIGETFSFPTKLKGQINTIAQEGHCSLSPDGKTLYFTSDRPGGFGGRDIYKAKLQADSTWGNVVNLGDSINTKYDEDSPFIHPDGSSLFYSSNGPKSSGGHDIFRAYLEASDSSFKKIENLSFPINSPDDDKYFVLAANGTRGYYSSGKAGGEGLNDIYLVETGFEAKTPVLLFVKGKVTFDGTPVESSIKVEVTSKNNSVFNIIKTIPATGNYMVSMPPGQSYKITYSYKDEKPKTFEFDASQITAYTEKIVDIKFETPKDTIPVAAIIPGKALPNEFDKEAITLLQKKISKYSSAYGKITAEGLEFKVQIAAYKNPKNYKFKHLKGLGKVEKLMLPDGLTRMTINGTFKTLEAAWIHNKKVIKAGQDDAFVTALYQGKRVYLEELVKMGIFK
ncbi:MAG: PD40 domain-containing protein [Bacteroidetes bacterium]|nr:PD40 domain-containing protein [Bacteroidota bacterium]